MNNYGKQNVYLQKNETKPILLTSTKSAQNGLYLNMRHETLKLLNENTKKTLQNKEKSRIFFYQTPKAQGMYAIISN